MTEPKSSANVGKSSKTFHIRFEPAGVTFEADPADFPYGSHGEPGSILDIALKAGVEIEHTCGGYASCSTCHVIVREGLESCNEESDKELDQLDNAPGLTTKSRLACQCIPDGSHDLTIEIPEWNRNIAKEGK